MGASDWEPVGEPRQRPIAAWAVGGIALAAMVVFSIGLSDTEDQIPGRLEVAADSSPAAAEARADPSPSVVRRPTAAPIDVALDRDVPYHENHRLDVWYPTRMDGTAPIVVMAHGASRDKAAYSWLARRIAQEGVIVYNANWHDAAPEGLADHVEAAEAISCAVRFARSTASDYGGASHTVTLVGHDAGVRAGMTVALAGRDFAGGCGVKHWSPLPEAFIGVAGIYRYEQPRVERRIGASAHVRRNPDLRVRLLHGWADLITPMEEVLALVQELVGAGYDARALQLIDAGHENLLYLGHSRDSTVQTVVLTACPNPPRCAQPGG